MRPVVPRHSAKVGISQCPRIDLDQKTKSPGIRANSGNAIERQPSEAADQRGLNP